MLCGGYGTRFRGVSDKPKILAPLFVEQIPAIEIIYCWALRSGFHRVVFLAGHRSLEIANYLNGKNWSYDLFSEESPRGTLHAVRTVAENLLPDEFYVCNGDTIFSEPFPLLGSYVAPTIFCVANPNPERYGSVWVRNGRVTHFQEKSSSLRDGDLVSSGIIFLRKRDLSRCPLSNGTSLERDLYPALAAEGILSGVQLSGSFCDYGVPDAYTMLSRMKFTDFQGYVDLNLI